MTPVEEIIKLAKSIEDEAFERGRMVGIADERARVLSALGMVELPKEEPKYRDPYIETPSGVREDRSGLSSNLKIKEVLEKLPAYTGVMSLDSIRTAGYAVREGFAAKEDCGKAGHRYTITIAGEEFLASLDPLPEPVDCATLAPLTPMQFKVFSVMVAARGEYLPSSEIDKRSGIDGSYGSLAGVRDKGYLIRRHAPGRPKNCHIYHVACFGAPRVEESNKGAGPHSGLTKKDLMEEVKIIVEQPAPLVEPEPVPQAIPEEPEEETDVDLDDLSKGPREVLLALSALGGSGKEAAILGFADVTEARMPSIMTRLSELKLISPADDSWGLTNTGKIIARAVKREEG